MLYGADIAEGDAHRHTLGTSDIDAYVVVPRELCAWPAAVLELVPPSRTTARAFIDRSSRFSTTPAAIPT
jgi:hypothetical protein